MKRLLIASAGLLLLALSPAQATGVCPTPIIPDGQAASQSWERNMQAVLEKICANLDTLVAGGSGAGISDINLKQIGGATALTGTGAQGAASPRVTVAVDSATVAGSASLPAGTASIGTVQPGNTPNTTPWLVAPTPAGGTAISNYSANVTTAGSGAGTGGVAVGSSGIRHLFAYQIYNGNSTVCYIQFLDQTQALTNLGTTVPVKSIGIPANGGANMVSAIPIITTATALTIGATTTRAGSTACSTGLDINLDYN